MLRDSWFIAKRTEVVFSFGTTLRTLGGMRSGPGACEWPKVLKRLDLPF